MEGNQITKEFLKKLLRSDLKVYFTSPEMNEHLYLHYKSNCFLQTIQKVLAKLKIWKNLQL